MANIGEQHEGKMPDAEGPKRESKQLSPMERLDAIAKQARGGTRAARSEATEAIKARVAGVESAGGTAADKAALETKVAPGLGQIDGVAAGAEARIEAVAAEPKSPDELAEEIMTPAQKRMSETQARDMEHGGVFEPRRSMFSRALSPAELQRYPGADGASDMSGQLPDGKKFRVHVVYFPQDYKKDSLYGGANARDVASDQFFGTIDGEEISSQQARELYIQGLEISKARRFREDETNRANWERDEQGLEKNYKPTAEELARADAMLTPTQREMSERQERLVDMMDWRGTYKFVAVERDSMTPTVEELARWPNAKAVRVISGILQGDRLGDPVNNIKHPDPKVRVSVALEPGMNSFTAPAENFTGTIDGEELSPEKAQALFKMMSNTSYAADRYKDAAKANAEVEVEAEGQRRES